MKAANSCCHVVAIPYPGRGHINPMMNLCKLLVSNNVMIKVTFVVTEEWLSFIGSVPKPLSITFQTIPNVIPSELIRATIFAQFVKSVLTKMEAPVEQLIDHLLHAESVSAIIADTYLPWAVGLGNRKNISVASLWPMSPSVFSTLYHFHLLEQNGHFPADLSERGNEVIDYIPGVTPTRLSDFPTFFSGTGKQLLGPALEAINCARKAQCVLFTSFYEIEHQLIDKLKETLPIPVYCLGALIPRIHSTDDNSNTDYFIWLNSQPEKSVLYISLGSFLSVSKEQMEEIVEGVRASGVRYLWVARDDSLRIQEVCSDGKGVVVPWCDQLKVLCHASVGGFWTHCGWSSTLEGVFAGVPMLTFPIFLDQIPNKKLIVDDWKIGMNLKEVATREVVGRHDISASVKRLMGLDGDESKEIRRKAGELKEMCRESFSMNGSSEANLNAFVREVLECN